MLIAEIMHTPLLKKFVIRFAGRYSNLSMGLKRLEEAQLGSLAEKEKISSTRASLTYTLRVWCLGQERIERDGVLVTSSDFQATMARELFYYLLFRGATTREIISLAFWPDDAPRQVRSNFHSTLHRARHAVGANTILFQDDLYSINPEINLWCDVRELQALVQQAKLLPPRSAHTENLWRRAVALYQGEFLPFTNAEWAIGLRTALQETYLEALVGLANAARARRDHSAAIGVLKRALEIDPYREDIHRNILTCHAEQGERGLVLEHLENLRQLLHRDLGVSPSEETLSLVVNLLDSPSVSSTT
jgi:DNA-binding SARP family transcriptional activator